MKNLKGQNDGLTTTQVVLIVVGVLVCFLVFVAIVVTIGFVILSDETNNARQGQTYTGTATPNGHF